MSEITDRINDIYVRFESVDFKKEIKNELRTINDFAKALDGGALLVVIIGNVKAGKSTFCNILANDLICQIGNSECTNKPLFISKGYNEYRTYKRAKGSISNKNLTFEQILSNIIRNSTDEIEGIEINTNDKSADSPTDANENRDYLLTSFSVDENEMVKDNVIYVDMPGLDGSNYHFDAIQQILLSRADYVLFVQLSSTDFNLVNNKVFNDLYEVNPGVMMSMIMNLEERRAWDKTVNEREDATDKMHTILNNTHFSRFRNRREDLSVVVNLGKLDDRRQGKYTAETDDEYQIFNNFVHRFAENVINKSDDFRQVNIEKNIISRINKLLNQVETEIDEREKRIKQYNDFQEQANTVSDLIDNNLSTDSSRSWTIDTEKLFSHILPTTTATTRYKKVKEKIKEYNDEMKNDILFLFKKRIEAISKELKGEFDNKVKALNTDFNTHIKLTTDIKASASTLSIPDDNECIKCINEKFTTIEDLIDPQIFWTILTFGVNRLCFWKSRVDDAAKDAQQVIIGKPGNKSAQIELFERKMNDVIKDAISKYVYDLSGKIRHNVEDKCKRKINGIILNYEDYVSVKDELIELRDELRRIVKGE
ncbi:MAG: dynamin family protein [Bacteroidales bacterium]|nr:dynamin family protein [Bacteroidales bacterium]